jgi:serine/threonine protein kinase
MQTNETRWIKTFKHANTSNLGIQYQGTPNQSDTTVKTIVCTSKIPDPPSILAPRRLTRLSRLGKGTYGIVYTGRQDIKIETVKNPSTGNPSNINSTYRPSGPDPRQTNTSSSLPELAIKRNIVEQETTYIGSVKELDLLSRMRGHPFIVDLLAISFENPFNCPLSPLRERTRREDNLFFVFEKGAYDGNTLIYGGRAAFGYIKLAMVQSLTAMEYMHGKGVIHRDIKPSNMLWFRDGHNRLLKLCDFGLSKIMTQQEPTSPKVVTSWYRAPEIMFRWNDYTDKSDIWSMGCVFFELLSKRAYLKDGPEDDRLLFNYMLERYHEPLDDFTLSRINKTKMHRVRSAREYRPISLQKQIGLNTKDVEGFNGSGQHGNYGQFLDLLTNMMKLDPDRRINATDALNHQFFNGYRDYIQKIRSKYPPNRTSPDVVRIMSGSEIKWAISIIYTIYKGQKSLVWYKPRIIFQSLDMFHRYIQYLEENGLVNNDVDLEATVPDNQKGRYHTKFETELRMMVCIYLSIKYFTTMHSPCSYHNLVTAMYKTPLALKEAEEFEMVLITTILKNRIYRSTLYEASDDFGVKLEFNIIGHLLVYFGNLTPSNKYTYHDLFAEFMPDVGNKKPVFLNIDTTLNVTMNGNISTPEMSDIDNRRRDHTSRPKDNNVYKPPLEPSMKSKNPNLPLTNEPEHRNKVDATSDFVNGVTVVEQINSDLSKDPVSTAANIPDKIIPIPTYAKYGGSGITTTRVNTSRIGIMTGNISSSSGMSEVTPMVGRKIIENTSRVNFKTSNHPPRSKEETSSESDLSGHSDNIKHKSLQHNTVKSKDVGVATENEPKSPPNKLASTSSTEGLDQISEEEANDTTDSKSDGSLVKESALLSQEQISEPINISNVEPAEITETKTYFYSNGMRYLKTTMTPPKLIIVDDDITYVNN